MPRTLVFPVGNIAPDGSVVKATGMQADLFVDGLYTHVGKARVFTSEAAAIQAIKGQGSKTLSPGNVLILAGCGPAGTGMEETYQLTAALKYLEWGKQVPLITDARFSGVSTGACIGHVGPEALAGGPLGKLIDDDLIEIVVDTSSTMGMINLVGHGDERKDLHWGERELQSRPMRTDLAPAENLPDDTRLWSSLQQASGGTWGGCVYDVDAIVRSIQAQRE